MKITTFAKAIVASLITTISFGAVAQDANDDINQEARILVGGKGLATDFGLEYERRESVIGKTFYAQMGKRRDTDEGTFLVSPEQWILGAGYSVHLRDSSDFDVYIAPSIALIHQKDVPNNKQDLSEGSSDVTTAGPALKIGSLYTMARRWTVGAEFVMMNNWFSDKIAPSQTFGNAVVGYKF